MNEWMQIKKYRQKDIDKKDADKRIQTKKNADKRIQTKKNADERSAAMSEEKMILEAEQVSRHYHGPGKQKVEAVRGLSIGIREGSCRGIAGESGCGKSTLLRMLAGLEKPDSGRVLYRGDPIECRMLRQRNHQISRQRNHQRNHQRNRIQMIFQNSMNAVSPYASAEEIIGEPLRNFFSMKRPQRREKAAYLLEQVGLSADDLTKYPAQFSGGQLQRICIARALAAEPEILLLDEPLSSLDVSVQAQIMNLLGKLRKECRLTQVLVSHDLEAVYYLSDSLSVMYGGYIIEEIENMDLFDELCHPYTKRLLFASTGKLSRQMPPVSLLLSEQPDAVNIRSSVVNIRSSVVNIRSKAAGVRPNADNGCPYAGFCPNCTELCRKCFPELRNVQSGHSVRCFNDK